MISCFVSVDCCFLWQLVKISRFLTLLVILDRMLDPMNVTLSLDVCYYLFNFVLMASSFWWMGLIFWGHGLKFHFLGLS